MSYNVEDEDQSPDDHFEEDMQKHEHAFLRASTCQVDPSQLRGRLSKMESYLRISNSSKSVLTESMNPNSKTCVFDPTKHILDYLPTPVLHTNKPGAGEKNGDVDDDSEITTISDSLMESSIYSMSAMKHLGMTEDQNTGAATLEKSHHKAVSMQSAAHHVRFAGSQDSDEHKSPTNDNHSGKSRGLRGSFTKTSLAKATSSGTAGLNLDPPFQSMFRPEDMRMLALVSHNNMKHSMKQFVMANKNVLKKFRVTGTNTTMTMLREVFGDDPDVVYGPSCKSGPLGGDAQLVAMAVTGELGGCIFFIDPMDAHPHSADIDCLVRQGNVHNILMMNNPCSAHVCMNACRVALKTGHMEMIPSFFFNLESPSVEAYKMRQKAVLQSTIQRRLSSIRLSGNSSGSRGSVRGSGKRQSVIEEIVQETLTEELLAILEEEDAAMDELEEDEKYTEEF